MRGQRDAYNGWPLRRLKSLSFHGQLVLAWGEIDQAIEAGVTGCGGGLFTGRRILRPHRGRTHGRTAGVGYGA